MQRNKKKLTEELNFELNFRVKNFLAARCKLETKLKKKEEKKGGHTHTLSSS